MEELILFLASLRPTSLMPVALLLLAGGGLAVGWSTLTVRGEQNDVKRRLKVETQMPAATAAEPEKKKNVDAVREKAAKTAHEFYAKSDPENVARLRLKLIQAGYMDPGAVGTFFLVRFGCFFAGAVGAFLVNNWMASAEATTFSRWSFVIMAGAAGYFLPGLVLGRLITAKMREYRNGFPDFMDLMIVCSDAGMAMEAGIERVSKELATSYPGLSQNLQLVSLELRAGRSLDDALKSLAEEKAHALPAKMSVPVTVCILPVVLMVAIIPIIVKMSAD